MKITLAFKSLINGAGIPNTVVALANEFANQGEDVSLLTFNNQRNDIDNHVLLHEIKLLGKIPLGFMFSPCFLKSFPSYVVGKALSKINPDIVNVWYTPFDELILQNKKGLNFKVVYYYFSVTDPNIYEGKARKRRIIESEKILSNVKKADLVITSSNFIQHELYSSIGVNSDIVSPGVDLQLFRPKKESIDLKHPAILCVGRITKHKGFHFLLDAFIDVLKEIPNANLYIIGKFTGGEYSDIIKKRIFTTSNIHYLGEYFEEILARYYANSNVFACASIYEGFGMPFLEAMACGTPCIGFNTCSIPEVVVHKKTGLLVEKENTAAFADAIIELLTDNEKREKMGKNARKYAEQYDWKIIAKKMLRKYEKIL